MRIRWEIDSDSTVDGPRCVRWDQTGDGDYELACLAFVAEGEDHPWGVPERQER